MRFRSSEHTNKPKLEVVWSNQPKTVYFLKDHLGSVRATVDQTGAVVGYDDYDPWGYILEGRTQPTEWSVTQEVSKNKFTGNVFDNDFGLNWGYHVDRFYDSEVGRWWSVDPVDQYSLSPYVYGANNPVVIIDPFGADTIYVDWPNGKRTAHYIPDNVVEAKRESDEGLVRPRPGRFLGLAFLAVGEALGQNDFIRARTGVDPFSNQQISGVERAISGVSAASTILPVNRIIQLKQFFKAKKFAKALSKASRTKPLTQAEVDEALKIAKFEGLKVRIDINDLKGDHFVGGPHIHIEELHIRVEAGVTVTP